jgi:predicted  nucleic acid-binding Zn-ribbon protein
MKLVTRIALILAILAGLGSGYCIYRVQTERAGLRVDKRNLTTSLGSTTNLLVSTEGTLKDTTTTLNTTSNTLVKIVDELSSTNKILATTVEERDKTKTELADANTKLQSTTTELTSAKEAIKKHEETIASQTTQIAKIQEIKKENADMAAENKTLGAKLAAAIENVKRLTTENEDLRRTPVNCRGRVAAVDTRWNFVVLDIGLDQKVRKETQFLIYRENNYVCKAQVISVAANTALAEVLSELRNDDPQIGDVAIH